MKRLKVYVLLLTIVLIGTIVPSFISSFSQEFNKGREDAREKRIAFYFNLKCDESHSFVKEISFQDTQVPIEITSGSISIPKELLNKLIGTSAYNFYLGYTICMYLVAFPIFLGFIWILINIFKLLRSVLSTRLFEHRNISRISSIAYTLLGIEILSILTLLLSYYSFEKLFTIAPYKMDYWYILEKSQLVLVIIILVMNELLRIATTMKEEQELTI